MIDPRNGFNLPDCSNEALLRQGAASTAAAADAARPARFADIEEPLEALLIWAFALRASAPKELCMLLGMRDFDASVLSERQQQQLEELKAVRAADEIFSREELGRLLRTQLGLQISRCDSPLDIERLARAAARMPVWVFDPQLAEAEDSARMAKATQTRMEAELAREEVKTRKLESKARAAIAKQAIADPRLFSSSQVKLAAPSEAAFEQGVAVGRAEALSEQSPGQRQQAIMDALWPMDPQDTLESSRERLRGLISLIQQDLDSDAVEGGARLEEALGMQPGSLIEPGVTTVVSGH
ncbi:hypothetical protein IT575_00045 [bacterium]|nr:hypothetical protein [bacterium]